MTVSCITTKCKVLPQKEEREVQFIRHYVIIFCLGLDLVCECILLFVCGRVRCDVVLRFCFVSV
jgi:hypothetical protein